MKLTIIDNIDNFYILQKEWNELLANSNNDTIFLRWEWLYNWWLVYGRGACRLFVIIVRDNKQLIGIAPFYIKMHMKFFREINFLGSNIVCSDYLDFILLKGKEEAALSSICFFLKQHEEYWDILHLSDMPSVSSSINFVGSFFKKYKKRIKEQYTSCPYINLNLPWNDIYNSYASILKNIIRRKSKKIEKSDSGLVEIKPDDDIEKFFSEFLRLNKLSLQKRGIRSPFYEKDFLEFHRKIIRALFGKEKIKFYFLKKDGKYIAGIYILIHGTKYYYYQSGFDPTFENDSPGTLLFHYCIKAAYENGVKEFDFLRGNEPYKRNWTEHARTNVKISVFNCTTKGRLLGYIDNLIEFVKKNRNLKGMHLYIASANKKIKRLLKMAIAAVFFYSGVFFIVRAINNLTGKRLTIVSYHRFSDKPVYDIDESLPYLFVSQASFELQIKFFKKFYNIIKFSDLNKLNRYDKLPPNSLIITIDDGYEDNYTVAYPILKKYNVPATIYLATDNIGNSNIYWWDELYYILTILNKNKVLYQTHLRSSHSFDLMKRFKDDPASLFSCLNHLDKSKIYSLLESLRKLIPDEHNLISSNKFLDWEQIIEMRSHVDFGSHTCSHSSFEALDEQSIISELTQSKDIIKKAVGSRVISFAYPAGHHSKKAAELVQEAGYSYAVTLDRGLNDLEDRYALKRINIWEGAVKPLFGSFSRSLLALTVSGIR